ncbi:Uncharacterised protein [Yersinia massiliensis]|nr:Uncharacterised protein [Yersinia massiliensis]
MPNLLMLIALLRKLIKFIVSFFLISTPLMAVEPLVLKDSDSTFSYKENRACINKICFESKNNNKMPDMFEKPDRFSQRERTDPWSTYDFDHSSNFDNSSNSVHLSIDL